MVYLTDTFKLSMIQDELPGHLLAEPIFMGLLPQDLKEGNVVPVIKNPAMVSILSDTLDYPLTYSRVNISLAPYDTLYLAEYSGPKLAENATELPPNGNIHFYRIRLD